MANAPQITKKKKAVLDGVFKAELNNFLMKELAEDGYSGVEVRRTPARAEVIIMATRTQSVLGERGRRIKELTSVVQKRFGFEEGSVELYAEKVSNRGLCAVAQCESLRYKLVGGLAVRRACYGVLRFIMESQAQGCEVIVSGKLRGQRAKAMKFVDGLMIHSGYPVNEYIQQAVRHVQLRQGVIGIKVKIMLPHDPRGQMGPKNALPDHVQILKPIPEENPTEPISEHKVEKKDNIPIISSSMQPVEYSNLLLAPLSLLIEKIRGVADYLLQDIVLEKIRNMTVLATMADGHEVSPSNQAGGPGPTHLIAALNTRGAGPQPSQQIQSGSGGPIRVQLQQQNRAPHIVPYPQNNAQPGQQIRTVQQVYQHSPAPQQRIVHQLTQRPIPQPMVRVNSNPQATMQLVHTGPTQQPQPIHVSSSSNIGSRQPTTQQPPVRQQVASLPGSQPPPAGTNVQQMLAQPSSNGSIMDRTRIDEITRQISSYTVLDDIVKDLLCDYIDEYINELVHHVCRMVKHRGNHRIEARDVEFVLDVVYKMPSVPRASVHVFGAQAAIRPDRITPQPTEAHKQRMLLIKKVVKKP
ncbi:ribosomal protein S3 [Dictyocaulus viviparus]|uniref:Transcription initiation factor TFIID subunit 12 n=1 Tax=Dictyocaulus viviparus TaxID=29172 RepID=A0A0D8XJA6_DICVI|nr:ribosomal protein S3 [Dictyocaulus viviparus]